MREVTVWKGSKRGVKFEINRFDSFDKTHYKYSWTYYLWLSPEQFPESARNEIKTSIYYTAFGTPIEVHRGPINDLEWHGGLTWSSNESNPRYPFERYKFGCDFQHLWDMDQEYDLKDIEREVERCVASIYERWPDFKTDEALWNEFRDKFPKEKAGGFNQYDVNAKPIERV